VGAVSDAWERAKDWMSDKMWQPMEDMGLDVPGYENKNVYEFQIPDEPIPGAGGGGIGGGGMEVTEPPNPDSAGQYLGQTLEEDEKKRKKISKKKLGTRALQIPLNVTEASPTMGLGGISPDLTSGLRI